MKLIIYSKQCTQCRYKNALEVIKNYSKKNGYLVEIKNTLSNRYNTLEAENIGQALPFVYNPDTHKATQLLGVTHEKLEELRGIS